MPAVLEFMFDVVFKFLVFSNDLEDTLLLKAICWLYSSYSCPNLFI